jgi:hypothetical protein
MFRQSSIKRRSFVLSTRVRRAMADDILREARKRKLLASEEVRRRLEFYAAHKHLLEPPAADQQPTA